MQERKHNPKLQIFFSTIMLALIFIIELYAMINLPDQFLVIGVLGILFLACLYWLVRAILQKQEFKEARREEQYDNIVKAEKASYLMLKKYFEEFGDQLEVIEKTSKLPTEEIVGTQKGIGKVIINRNRENAEAIISSNDVLLDTISGLKDAIMTNNDRLVDSYRSINDENLKHYEMKQQEMSMSLKDMEIRLDNAIMQSQKVVTQAAPVYAAPVMPAPAAPVAPEPAPVIPEETVEEVVAEPVVEEVAEPVVEEIVEPVVAEIAEPVVEEIAEPVIEETVEVEAATEEIVEPVVEEIEEPVVEEVAEPVVEEVEAPAPDLSDPNKKMDADEIAALFASMGQESAPAEEPVVEEVAEPVVEEVVEPEPEPIPEPEPAPAPEPTPAPAPEPADANKQLGPDEIAALFASMTQEVTESAPEPVEEKPAPQVDLSDPNKQLSPDEIAALFANMGA
jgi:hypothetical protein